MVMSRDSRITGQFRISTPYNLHGCLTTAVMTLVSLGLVASIVR
jgi:hypothetical protein